MDEIPNLSIWVQQVDDEEDGWKEEEKRIEGCKYIVLILFYIISLMKKHLTFFNIARVLAAIILLQTLFFKFSAHPESVELFTTIGMEPWWRIWVWIAELVVGLLLLFWRKYIWCGAVGAIGLMVGAVYFHIVYLGINQLFWMAVLVLVCSIYVVYETQEERRPYIQEYV